jgi:hypothetical protein
MASAGQREQSGARVDGARGAAAVAHPERAMAAARRGKNRAEEPQRKQQDTGARLGAREGGLGAKNVARVGVARCFSFGETACQ